MRIDVSHIDIIDYLSLSCICLVSVCFDSPIAQVDVRIRHERHFTFACCALIRIKPIWLEIPMT